MNISSTIRQRFSESSTKWELRGHFLDTLSIPLVQEESLMQAALAFQSILGAPHLMFL